MFVYLPRIFFWKGLDIYLSFFKCLKPNILFLVIDSFRADKFSGSNKSSLTPNIDKMIQNGTYFKQAISSADGTLLSWSSLLTALHPFKTGIRSEKLHKINPDIKTYFDILKDQGYYFYSQLPSLSKTVGIFPEFENEDSFFDYYLTCTKGLGKKIINMLESDLKTPWLAYLHIEDLHFPIEVPPDVNDEKYGLTNFDKAVSNLDTWIGRFIEKIDLEKTIVVLVSDHGSYLTSINHNGEQISLEVNSSLQTTTRNIGKAVPNFLKPVKSKTFFALEKIRKQKRLSKVEKFNLKNHEKRGLLWQRSDVDHFLFDDVLHVPLVFLGYGIKSNIKISQQVRTIDIFPTICEIIGLANRDNEIDGRSLLPLIEGRELQELPNYIESSHLSLEIVTNDVIGIRTSNYKYFRDIDNPKNRIHLFNLKEDPFEDENIAAKSPEIVDKHEDILQKMIKDSPEITEEINEEETKKIEEELKKLGYM